MKKLILLCLFLISCQRERPIPNLLLSVLYPAEQSLVKGGQCAYGALLLVDAYLDGYEITPEMLGNLQDKHPPLPGDIPGIAWELFGMSVQLEYLRFSQLRDSLERNLPVILLFCGDTGYQDAVVLVGMMSDGAILHYPVWPWSGSGAYVFVAWNRFYELYTGWGYEYG